MSELNTRINIVVNEIFTNLNKLEKNEFVVCLNEILTLIKSRFYYNNIEEQFYNNNYKDIRSLINILIPYINDDNGSYKYHKMISSFENISELKHNNKFVISNIKYNYTDNNKKFNIDIIKENKDKLKKTIYTVANKLHVNWSNCVPINIDEYKDLEIYKTSYKYTTSKKFYKKHNISNNLLVLDIRDIDNIKYNGLHLYDIYNSIVNYLYFNILPCKWLIYEIKQNKVTPIIFVDRLLELFPVLYNNKKWNYLQDDDKILIENSWIDLLNLASELDKYLITSIIIHYENYIKNHKIFKDVDIDEIDDYEEKNLSVDKENLENLINENYKINDIYDYLLITFNYFKTTWYGHKIIKEDNTINNNVVYNNINIKIRNLTVFYSYKNIYNWCKHFYITIGKLKFEQDKKETDYKGKLINYPREARLIKHIKNTDNDDFTSDFKHIINLLNNDNIALEYKFKIKKNIEYIYRRSIPDNDAIQISSNIDEFVKQNLINFVFETYIYNGILTKILTDNKSIFTNDNIDNYENSIYYLTGEKYNKIKVYDSKTNQYTSYIKSIKKSRRYYALDWMFQIGFYHTFLNNNVLLVTGSTGQGKSTQIPKLLYYANKTFLFKNNTRIISTQPRKSPTKENAKFIAEEMGVPLLINKYNTLNGYVQYNSKDDKHLITDNKSYIKEVTDKILLNELIADLKLTDKYDVVIVDEAHEHNQNMDLILTIMKKTLEVNLNIKLVITSATMDYDEARYRWFYKSNNITEFMRVDISPPGETTKYKIEEIWNNRNPKDYEESEKIALDIIEKLCNTTTQGNILFFSIGVKEITNICKKLNNTIPLNFIALPYYGSLESKWLDIIKINDIDAIDFDRKFLFDEIKLSNTAPKSSFKYNRIIIVATNAAEASLSFIDLKYVVDTGYQRSIIYNPDKDINKVVNDKITNSQRIQRRGRVGRISDGFVYYTYNNNYLDGVISKYNICITDFTSSFFALLNLESKTANKITLFNSDTLIDKYGEYYLIHPNELEFTRDENFKPYKTNNNIILVDIIDGQEKRPIPSGKMDLIIKKCIYNNLIYKKDKFYYKDIFSNHIYNIYTEIGDLLPSNNELISILLIKSLIEAIKYKCINEMIILIAWYDCLSSSYPTKMFLKSKYTKYFSSNLSDFDSLLEIANLVIKDDDEYSIEKNKPNELHIEKYKKWLVTEDWTNINIINHNSSLTTADKEDNYNSYYKIYNYLLNKNDNTNYIFKKKISTDKVYGLNNDVINIFYTKYMNLIFVFKNINNEIFSNNKYVNSIKKLFELSKYIDDDTYKNNLNNNNFYKLESGNKDAITDILIKCFPTNIFEYSNICKNITFESQLYPPISNLSTYVKYVSGFFVFIDKKINGKTGETMPIFISKTNLSSIRDINKNINYII
jgi:hypothetical protein